MTAKIEVEAKFMNLDPEEQRNYELIRDQVHDILALTNGLELVLNALIANGSDTSLDEIGRWVAGVEDTDKDPRDLVAICYNRPITVKSTIVDA
jgi:hypothetical protein